VTLLSEWLQETQDLQLAQQLSKALETERDCEQRIALIQGEAEAIKIAVEEKRRIKAEAQAKLDIERADEEFARKLAADEVKYFEDKKRQFEDDEKYCYTLEEQEKGRHAVPLRVESKDENDEEECKDDATADTKGSYDDDEKESYCDAKETFREEKEASPVAKPAPVVDEDEEKEGTPETLRQKKRALRSKLQRQRIEELPSSHPFKKYNFNTLKEESVISKLWEKANVEINEIDESLCLTVQLPNIQKLHIGMENHGKLMKIHAKRYLRKNKTSSSSAVASLTQLLSSDSTQYQAEFVLDGEISVTTKDIYHEYYQEYGTLFIYIENICLDEDSTVSSSNILGKGKNLLNSFKKNFLRIFNKN
jgi:hypothetical protein